MRKIPVKHDTGVGWGVAVGDEVVAVKGTRYIEAENNQCKEGEKIRGSTFAHKY